MAEPETDDADEFECVVLSRKEWAARRRHYTSHLREFTRELYPTFERHGFTLPEAYQSYLLRMIFFNTLPPDEDDEENEETWRSQ